MILFILKTTLCSALLLGTYFLLLEKEKMHRFNRFFLLFGIAFSLVVPFITITIETSSPATPVSETIMLISEQVRDTVAQQAYIPVKEKNIFPVLLISVYLLVTAILLYRFLKNLYVIWSAARTNRSIAYPPARLVLMNQSCMPSSFLHYIFIPAKEYADGSLEKEVLCHELAHVKQKHSLDILFVEFLLVFLWINPFFFLYKKAIRLNHEFLADEKVVTTFRDTRFYQLLLLNKAIPAKNLLLSSPLNYPATKKRLVMITKTTSYRTSVMKKLALLPVIIFIILAFGMNKSMIAQKTGPETNKPASSIPAQPKKPVDIKKIPWADQMIAASEEGASQQLLDEYKSIVSKYTATKEQRRNLYQSMTPADRDRLEAIFKQMNRDQQLEQTIFFVKPSKPMAKTIPSSKDFESWKNDKVYGVWIDGKRIDNSTLDNYSHTDFDHFFVSRLTKNAVNYGKHYYQVDLMTKDYYKDYYNKAINNKTNGMVIRWIKTDITE